jgi:hypothetical protein
VIEKFFENAHGAADMALSHVNGLAAGSAPELGFCAQGGTCCAGGLGLQAVPLLPDLQHDLAAGMPACDPGQRLAGLVWSSVPPLSMRYDDAEEGTARATG